MSSCRIRPLDPRDCPARWVATPLAVLLACSLLAGATRAADHRAEPVDAAVPEGVVSDDIRSLMADSGTRIIRGTSRTVCEIWLRDSWPLDSREAPTPGILYPFEPGQLVGVIHFPRSGNDFRDQDIEEGWYTLRFSLQPIDGAHVGTSITRDFLLMLPAEMDESPEVLDYDSLTEAAAESSGGGHPALLSLQKPEEGGAGSVTHLEEEDWWTVQLQGNASVGGETQPLPLRVVVAGYAEE